MKKSSKVAIATILTLILVFILSITSNIYAAEDIFTVIGVETEEKSATVEINKLELEDKAINSDIVFHKVGDYAKLKITIKNNDEKDYKIKSITDNNENINITYEYSDYSEKSFKAGETASFFVTIKYSNEVIDTSKRVQDSDVDIIVTFEDDLGNTATETISVNPKTGDNVMKYVTIFLVSAFALAILILSNKKGKKSKKILGLIIAIVLVTPVVVRADGNGITLNFKNKISLMNKIIATYVNDSGEEETKVVNYGDSLDPIEKEYYDFAGWFDEDDNKVESITEDIKLTPKWTAKEFKIDYVLNGGTADTITTYTIESDDITLPRPKRTGFIFKGWTGSNGDTPQKDVTIPKGSTGDKTYTANWVEGVVEVVEDYIHPSESPYSWFGRNISSWESTDAHVTTYPWNYKVPCYIFESSISRARLGYSTTEYVTYNGPDEVAGYIDTATKTKIWLGSSQNGSAVDGYYTLGYTMDGEDHELRIQISGGQVVELVQMY